MPACIGKINHCDRMLAILGLEPCEDIYEGRERIQRVLHENDMVDDLSDILKLAINEESSEEDE